MKKGEKFTLIIGIIVYLILLGVFIKMFGGESGGSTIKIWVPWGFIGLFIIFYLFREYNRVNKAKRHNRREEINARRQDLLDSVIKKKQDNSSL